MTRMTVNGQAVHYRLDPQTPLLWALRDASNLTGTKHACGSGQCGACTVIVDGRAATSCNLPIATLKGATVTTIEGLAPNRGHPLQQAWTAEQVSQCGLCDSGFIMALAALMQGSPDPSAEQLDALPNQCPCGIHPRVRLAVKRAVATVAAAAPPAALTQRSSAQAETTR